VYSLYFVSCFIVLVYLFITFFVLIDLVYSFITFFVFIDLVYSFIIMSIDKLRERLVDIHERTYLAE